MKYYKSYMDKQELSPDRHAKLLRLAPGVPVGRSTKNRWRRWGALAACCALILGVGQWRLAHQPQTAEGAVVGTKDTYGPGETSPDQSGFVVEGDDGKLMFPMLPASLRSIRRIT